jgi:hypothetical protein
VNEGVTNRANCVLHVMPQYETNAPPHRWNVYQLSDVSPRIMLVGSVNSCDEARRLASRERPLRIAEGAWRQMLAVGAAPRKTPKDVMIS